MRVRLLLLAALTSAVAWVSPAKGDELVGTRSQPIVERSHIVHVRVVDGVATYRVQRAFHNPSRSVADEARLTLRLPPGAAATGLRIKAGDRWYSGELMHARRAEELYQELTGIGPSEPKDPALLAWNWTDELSLRVFPVLPGKTSLVEYTLTAPTTYEGGVHYVGYPRAADTGNLVDPVVYIDATGLAGPVRVDGEMQRGRRTVLTRPKPHPVLAEHDDVNDRALVRSLAFDRDVRADRVALTVDVHHTWPGDLQIQLIDPDGALHDVLEFDFTTRENDLRETFVIDRAGSLEGTWHLLLTDHHPLDGGVLRSWSIAPARPGDTPAAGTPEMTSTQPGFIPQPVDGDGSVATLGITLRDNARETKMRLGRVALLSDKAFARLELDMARRLSEDPRRHAVVFVVDASHSVGQAGIDAQLRLIAAYLAHVPHARFALVGTRRTAEIWAPLTPAARLHETLVALRAGGKLVPGNGSFLDHGLRAARDLVASANGSQTIVLMTDNRLRPTWDTTRAVAVAQTLPEATVVHVVDASAGGPEPLLERDDEHRLFPVAKARGGVAVMGYGLDGKRSVLEREARYLVRPDRVDHPILDGLPTTIFETLDVLSLREGTGLRWMDTVDDAPTEVLLRGELWSTPFELRAETSEPFHRTTAAYVFSLDHYAELSETEQFVIASYGGAVSPVTSYLAIEPGVRPSTIGLEGIGFGAGGGAGRLRACGAHVTRLIDWEDLRRRVRERCPAPRGAVPVEVTVDATDHEIVDVHPSSEPSPRRDCVVEALWAEQLTPGPTGDASKRLAI